AVKYTLGGGTIRVRLELKDIHVRFEVIDSGLGIPKEQQDRLFQPFFRAVNARATQIEGTGLGLHLVKNIIEWHGVSMYFQNAQDDGSTFGFDLPAAVNLR